MLHRNAVRLATVVLAALVSSAACSQESAPVGTERGACYGNGTCDDGLVCLSELCVKPPPADCRAVAERLNYLILGNYAKQSERDAYISEMVTTCKQSDLSKEDADCIIEAKNRQALMRCPNSLVMGSCEKVVAHVNKILTGRDGALGDLLDPKPALRRCRQRGITTRDEACILAAKSESDLEACGGL